MDRFFEIFRRAGWVLVQSLILFVLFCAHIWLIYTNFTALKVSFELLGYDSTPQGDDLLFGFLWDTFGLYEVTQAHMFAAAIAFIVGILSMVAVHNAYLAVRLLIDRREYIRSGDLELAEQAVMTIKRHLILFCMVMLCLVPVASWDIQLFRFRSVVPLLKMEENAFAIKDWPVLIQQYGDLFAMSLARFGAWAYVLLVCGASLLVELWLNYVREALTRLGAALKAWYELITGTSNTDAEAANNQPVQQLEQQAATNVNTHENAYAINDEQSSGNTVRDLVQNQSSSNNTEINRSSIGNQNIEWPERVKIEPIYTVNNTSENTDEEVMVFGGRPGEKVKFSVAASDTETYYIDEMRRVWKRNFTSEVYKTEPAAAAA